MCQNNLILMKFESKILYNTTIYKHLKACFLSCSIIIDDTDVETIPFLFFFCLFILFLIIFILKV